MTVHLTELGRGWLTPQQAALAHAEGEVQEIKGVYNWTRWQYRMHRVWWPDSNLETWHTDAELERSN